MKVIDMPAPDGSYHVVFITDDDEKPGWAELPRGRTIIRGLVIEILNAPDHTAGLWAFKNANIDAPNTLSFQYHDLYDSANTGRVIRDAVRVGDLVKSYDNTSMQTGVIGRVVEVGAVFSSLGGITPRYVIESVTEFSRDGEHTTPLKKYYPPMNGYFSTMAGEIVDLVEVIEAAPRK